MGTERVETIFSRCEISDDCIEGSKGRMEDIVTSEYLERTALTRI